MTILASRQQEYFSGPVSPEKRGFVIDLIQDQKVSALDLNFRFQQMPSWPALLVDVNLNVGKIGQLTFTWKSVVQSHLAKAGQ